MNNAYKRTVRLIIIRVAANVLTVGAVVLAMYMSWLHPSEGLLVFCQWFFGITIATWFAAAKLSMRVRTVYADKDEGLVRLPGRRRDTLMRWSVAAPEMALLRPGRQQHI